jgi:metal-responsive CopG/Arc/MetJ family transcriptional regulator
MPTPLRGDDQMQEPVQRFTVTIGRPLLREMDTHLRRSDQLNRSAFVRRAILAELERDRRRMRMV